MSIQNRVSQLEKIAARLGVIAFDVVIVDEITDAMRQAQREAHARGQRYYIVEEADNEQFGQSN